MSLVIFLCCFPEENTIFVNKFKTNRGLYIFPIFPFFSPMLYLIIPLNIKIIVLSPIKHLHGNEKIIDRHTSHIPVQETSLYI